MSNEQREQQMMAAADRYADEVCDESCTGAMHGMMSDVDAIKTIFDHGKEQPITNRQEAFELVAEYAVNVADVLIAKLKKGEKK